MTNMAHAFAQSFKLWQEMQLNALTSYQNNQQALTDTLLKITDGSMVGSVLSKCGLRPFAADPTSLVQDEIAAVADQLKISPEDAIDYLRQRMLARHKPQ